MRHRRDRAGDATCQNTSGGALIVKQISASPRLGVTVQRFVDTLQGPPIYTLSPDVSRKGFEDAQASASVTKMPVDIQDTTISGDKTGDVSVRIFRPKDSTGTLPAVLYLHGGGWVVGSKETHDRLVREIACAADVAVVFVNYARSPEAKSPTALEQSYAVAQH